MVSLLSKIFTYGIISIFVIFLLISLIAIILNFDSFGFLILAGFFILTLNFHYLNLKSIFKILFKKINIILILPLIVLLFFENNYFLKEVILLSFFFSLIDLVLDYSYSFFYCILKIKNLKKKSLLEKIIKFILKAPFVINFLLATIFYLILCLESKIILYSSISIFVMLNLLLFVIKNKIDNSKENKKINNFFSYIMQLVIGLFHRTYFVFGVNNYFFSLAILAYSKELNLEFMGLESFYIKCVSMIFFILSLFFIDNFNYFRSHIYKKPNNS